MSLIAERLPELLRRDAYPHAASDVRLIETHISWVLLAGQYAYKLRKPVDFQLQQHGRTSFQPMCCAWVGGPWRGR